MNNLSWFMYLADILPNVQTLFAVFGGTILAGLMFGTLICAMENENEHAGILLKWTWAPALLIAIACFIPSTQAMYLIAGSEAGEMVVTSQEGKEILGDIKDVIRTQLNDLKK